MSADAGQYRQFAAGDEVRVWDKEEFSDAIYVGLEGAGIRRIVREPKYGITGWFHPKHIYLLPRDTDALCAFCEEQAKMYTDEAAKARAGAAGAKGEEI